MDDSKKLIDIRARMPVTTAKVYLNTGTAGPLANVTQDALANRARFELETGRGTISTFTVLMDDLADLRGRLAELTGTKTDEIALTHHTTEGVNIVAHGMRWNPGDQIVTTAAEHEGGLIPLYVLRQRHGVAIKVVEFSPDDTPGEVVAKLHRAIGPRTRLLMFSHVTWNTGLRLPMEELAAMARAQDVLTLIDGAQSAGAIPLDLPASGVDFYAMPAQKWLCGPEGLGALYVRRESLALLEPTFVGFFSLLDTSSYDLGGYFIPAPGARRFEVGTVYRPGIKAMAANLAWLAESVGWPWIHDRIEQLARTARGELLEIPAVTMITPADAGSGLLSFSLDGYDSKRVVAELEEMGIVLRSLDEPVCLRISLGFFNTEDDIKKLRSALETVTTLEPESLPAPLF